MPRLWVEQGEEYFQERYLVLRSVLAAHRILGLGAIEPYPYLITPCIWCQALSSLLGLTLPAVRPPKILFVLPQRGKLEIHTQPSCIESVKGAHKKIMFAYLLMRHIARYPVSLMPTLARNSLSGDIIE